MSVQHAQLMLAEIRKVTAAPIRYLFYSHNHYDHAKGGQVRRVFWSRDHNTTSYWPGVQGRGCGDRGPRGGLRVHQGEPQRGPRAARHQVDRGQVPRTNESPASGHVTQCSPLIGQVLRDSGRHHAGPLLHGGQPRQRHDGLRAPGTEGENT